jgi:hypothetical protein
LELLNRRFTRRYLVKARPASLPCHIDRDNARASKVQEENYKKKIPRRIS